MNASSYSKFSSSAQYPYSKIMGYRNGIFTSLQGKSVSETASKLKVSNILTAGADTVGRMNNH